MFVQRSKVLKLFMVFCTTSICNVNSTPLAAVIAPGWRPFRMMHSLQFQSALYLLCIADLAAILYAFKSMGQSSEDIPAFKFTQLNRNHQLAVTVCPIFLIICILFRAPFILQLPLALYIEFLKLFPILSIIYHDKSHEDVIKDPNKGIIEKIKAVFPISQLVSLSAWVIVFTMLRFLDISLSKKVVMLSLMVCTLKALHHFKLIDDGKPINTLLFNALVADLLTIFVSMILFHGIEYISHDILCKKYRISLIRFIKVLSQYLAISASPVYIIQFFVTYKNTLAAHLKKDVEEMNKDKLAFLSTEKLKTGFMDWLKANKIEIKDSEDLKTFITSMRPQGVSNDFTTRNTFEESGYTDYAIAKMNSYTDFFKEYKKLSFLYVDTQEKNDYYKIIETPIFLALYEISQHTAHNKVVEFIKSYENFIKAFHETGPNPFELNTATAAAAATATI